MKSAPQQETAEAVESSSLRPLLSPVQSQKAVPLLVFMKRILREPLLHFLLLGTAMFAAYGLFSKRTSGEPGKIVVTQGQVAAMAVGFTRTLQRPPTREELEGLIRDR